MPDLQSECFIKRLKSNQGSTLVLVMTLAVIGAIIISVIMLASRTTMKGSGHRRNNIVVMNIAEAGQACLLAELRLRRIKPTPRESRTVYKEHAFGSGTYTVSYRTNQRNDTIVITSIGASQNDTVKIEVIALLTPFGWRNWVKGAVTSPNDVSSLGNIIFDGRDHDSNGGLLGTGGTFGVSAGGSVSPSGSSLMGGGTTPPQSTIIEDETVDSNIDTTGYPTTPEEVLGLPPGTLDGFISGCPSPPLSGITYITSSCTDYTGSGVLICHNSDGDASLGNYHGQFKGLIIADEGKHFNGTDTIIGAVFMLGRDVGGNTFGNGDTEILYSSILVEQAIKDAYDLANKRWAVPIVSWKQVK